MLLFLDCSNLCRRSLNPYRSILIFVLVGCFSQVAVAFDKVIHKNITREALPFLKPNIDEQVIKGNVERDYWWFLWRKSDKWHFNECDFSGSTAAIQGQYAKVIEAFDPDNREKDRWFFEMTAHQFGTLLHTIQDFYSHSNWIELHLAQGIAKKNIPLVNADRSPWQVMQPWETLKYTTADSTKDLQVVIVQGSTESAAFKSKFVPFKDMPIEWNAKKKTATLKRKENNEMVQGLVSGRVHLLFFYFNNKAPESVKAEHWDHSGVNQLHKDNSEYGGPYHKIAKHLAIEQTKQEWHRLVKWVYDTKGKEGLVLVLDQWVADEELKKKLKAAYIAESFVTDE